MLPEQWLDAPVAVGHGNRGEPRWTATGFLYRHEPGGLLYLVTNRHVVADRPQLLLRLKSSDGSGVTVVGVDLTGASGPVYGHPDPQVDVAVVPVSEEAILAEGGQPVPFERQRDVMTLTDMQRAGVLEGDDVFVLGYPMELLDPDHNDVIVRGGYIARIRDCLARRSDQYLLDVFVFPGNSGSPVLLAPGRGTGGQRPPAALIGMVKAYVPYRDVAVSRQTGRERVVFEDNSGLARAHPVDHVLDAVALHRPAVRSSAGGGA